MINRRKRTRSLTGLKVRHGRKHAAVREQGFRSSDTTRLVLARKDVELGVNEPSRSYGIVQSGVQKVWLAHGWRRVRSVGKVETRYVGITGDPNSFTPSRVCCVELLCVIRAIPGPPEASHGGFVSREASLADEDL